jgi:hypothetical protein
MQEHAASDSESAAAQYEKLLNSVKKYFHGHSGPLFKTDADNLYQLYLANLPENERQSHTCGACENFLRRYGHLVKIDSGGKTHALMWNSQSAPALYSRAVNAMKGAVESARVTGVFLTKDTTLGTAVTPSKIRDWTHFSVGTVEGAMWMGPLNTPHQAMAEKLQDHTNMTRALQEFTSKNLTTAVKVLKSNALFRNEKVLGAAEWLKKTHSQCKSVKNKNDRENKLWLEIALAPAGFCHPRSSMIGSLLQDIEAGLEFDEVKSKFEAKMHPLQYQRPQALPSAGNIARAEKIFKELGAEKALHRRYARLEEIVTIWKSKNLGREDSKPFSIFSHVQPKPAPSKNFGNAMEIPPITMTWEKFKSTILDDAELIEYFAPHGKNSYGTLTTASDDDAPPILQWDFPAERNPFSFYLYVNGSAPSDWAVKPDKWCTVNAITLMPANWNSDKFTHHAKCVLFILDKAKDLKHQTAGLAIFPENLKSEFREVRSTIESHSTLGTIDGIDASSASGILFSVHDKNIEFALRVTTVDGCQKYRLDRWD